MNRFQRKQTLWQIERAVEDQLLTIPGLRFPAVFDCGATPLSTIHSTVDLMISGPDPKVLARLQDEVTRRLKTVGGLTAVFPTWTLDRIEYLFLPDAERLAIYGTDAAAVAAQVSAQVQGFPVPLFRVPGLDFMAVWVQAQAGRRENPLDLATLPVVAPRGSVPLSSLGRVEHAFVPTLHTRQNLQETGDVLGYRSTAAVTRINDQAAKAMEGLALPAGYTLQDEGERKTMDEAFSS